MLADFKEQTVLYIITIQRSRYMRALGGLSLNYVLLLLLLLLLLEIHACSNPSRLTVFPNIVTFQHEVLRIISTLNAG